MLSSNSARKCFTSQDLNPTLPSHLSDGAELEMSVYEALVLHSLLGYSGTLATLVVKNAVYAI